MTEDSAITMLFKKLGSKPLLKKEEERALFERYEAGDRRAKDALVERNLRLVVPTAKAYARCGVPFPDLVQEGSLAVSNAVDKFEWRRGNRFSTYATYWIRQRIGRYVKKHSKNVFVPEHVVNLAVQINKAKRALAAEGEESPDCEGLSRELLKRFGVSAGPDVVKETMEFCQGETSMSTPVGEDGETELGQMLEDEYAPDPVGEVDAEAMSSAVRKAVEALPDDERLVACLRYGVCLGPMTDAQVAEAFGVEESEVRAAKAFAEAALAPAAGCAA